MFIGVLKFTLEEDTFDARNFSKDASHLTQSLKKRFKVLVKYNLEGEPFFVVTAMADHEHDIDQIFDELLAHVEEKGAGRIGEEDRIIVSEGTLFSEMEPGSEPGPDDRGSSWPQ